MAAKVNALEVSASDEWQRGVAKVLRALVEGQAHAHGELGHHKKAMDLLLLEIFKVKGARGGEAAPAAPAAAEGGSGA